VKNIQPYIILCLAIIIVGLSWYVYSMNSDIDIYKKQIELSKLKTDKKSNSDTLKNTIKNLSKNSTKAVEKSKKLLKKITYEKPIIIDTTSVYMLEYIRNYRPE